MADRVINTNEVCLNSVIFPIDGFVRETSISRFPGKTITGDYEYSNEQILSNWITRGQRGGMLVEDMDESIHADRYWYSNCDTRYDITLGKLATAISAPDNTTAPTIVNADMEIDGGATPLTGGWDYSAAEVTQSSTQKHGGTYSIRFAGTNEVITTTEYIIGWTPGVQYTFSCWAWATDALGGSRVTKIQIGDGTQTITSTSVQGDGGWEQLSAQITVASTATYLLLTLHAYTVAAEFSYFDDATMTMDSAAGATAYGNVNRFAELNGILYAAYDNRLTTLNSGGTRFENMWQFPATITDLAQDGTTLIIALGDADEYWYMTATSNPILGDAIGETDELNNTYCIFWNDTLTYFDSAGNCVFTATPGQASPGTTADGSINVSDNELQSLDTYFDATGNNIIYCGTKVGVFAHDTDNNKFLGTAVTFPPHTTAGKGFVVFNDALYTSAGLNVKKYIAGGTAVVTDVGLNEDDGLPQLRSGEIVKSIKGYREMFVLIDSTYEGATSRSQVVSWDGRGWRTWWEATANNKNMYSGIVSSDTAYRLWFSTTDGIYYIPLSRTSDNPKRSSASTYATAGIHITPRFDGGTKSFPKLAVKATLYLADMSATSTITPTYQIDQATNAITSAWTALGGAIVTNGVTKISFSSSAGIVFYDIQFRLALARAGGTNTDSPVVKSLVLSYLKLSDRKKSWNFTINTVGTQSPKELVDAMDTILALQTLMPFTFRDGSVTSDTHYCIVQPYSNFMPTGANWEGKYNVTVVEV